MTQFIQDIMAFNPVFVTPEDPVTRAAELMVQDDTGFIPVVVSATDMHVAGVITDRDIVVRLVGQNKNPLNAFVSEAMSTNVQTLPFTSSLSEAANMMKDHEIRRLAIVDGDGLLKGVLSLGDLATDAQQPRLVADTLQSISQPSQYADQNPTQGTAQ